MFGRTARLARRDLEVSPAALRRLAAHAPDRYPVLLDSALAGPLGRYSLLLAGDGRALRLDRAGRLQRESGPIEGAGFLPALEAWWRSECAARDALVPEPELPWCGGFAVFLGYELAAEVEPVLHLPATPLPWQAAALRTPAAIVHDAASGRIALLAEPGADAPAWLARLEADLRAAESAPGGPTAPAGPFEIREDRPAEFIERLQRVQQHIAAGDVYQVNLSRSWQGPWPPGASSAALYERLRLANPAPFAAWWRDAGLEILSSSPERLVCIRDGRIATRPIAGTRPRRHGAGAASDAAVAAELARHPKERAEHVMLIDLERNDLGRVCVPGSVAVSDFMTIETYEHVHHIVSGVEGRLRADVTPVGALRAVFPGGTITGCPKVRCMQIIAELERCGRGAYTGSIGYLGLDGSADFNILIRTLTRSGGQIELRAGAGIVADSDAQRELEETRAKARGVLRALEGTA
ncbi:MAG: aminodeoxychorismate synthase component I [Steroidobacteraceae bacterium]